MSLESTATYVDSLNIAWPDGADVRSTADDHLRLLKGSIKRTFPNVTGAVTPTHTELNYVDGVTSAIQTQIDSKAAVSSGTFTATLTGCTTSPTATFSYKKAGGLASIYANGNSLTGESNASTMTITGIPAEIQPAIASKVTCELKHGDINILGYATVSSGTMTFTPTYVITDAGFPGGTKTVLTNDAFSTSGTKGVNATFCITYPLS